jgi:hypothetical protein
MAKICYTPRRFSADSLEKIGQANNIIAEYQRLGFDLTLRQLYYQFVSRDLIPNKVREYQNLGKVINNARLAGLIDWDVITDRTRNLRGQAKWHSPSEIVEACAQQFKIDLWEGQDFRPEVWIEKDALIGVIEGTCNDNRVDYFSCRGYVSQSEMHDAAMRLKRYSRQGQTPVIIHLGDHDPSGIDMTRDITDRLMLFMGGTKVERIALTMKQVEEFEPPPNPAKETDSRFAGYIEIYGEESWELDALNPSTLALLINQTVEKFRDESVWDERVLLEREYKTQLERVAESL